uniref:Monoacylglycerol lipase ABHD12-like n=1 Tax=Hirondellea gigas TaxID=1518452 RepID=A0A2P2I2R6_9CRUS
MLKRLTYSTFLFCLWMGGMSVSTVVWSACISLTVTYVLLPLLYKTCPAVPRHLVFLNFVCYPLGYDYNKPSKVGLEGVDNFYITVRPGVILGVWHLLPKPFNNTPPSDQDQRQQHLHQLQQHKQRQHQPGYCTHSDHYENELRDGRPVVLYLHGNSSSRLQPSRVALYKVLTGMGFHVITFDYRGYGDSSRVSPSEEGLVEDARCVYRYIRRVVGGNSPVIVWGHSLGTGVSCHAVRTLCDEGRGPDALILEAPFNNMRDEVAEHPFCAVFRKMPMFSWLFLDPLCKAGLKFTSDQHIEHINIPVLILHAHDDLVVPFKLGRRLYEYGVQHRPDHYPTIRFMAFAGRLGLGHKNIHASPKLPGILKQFFEDVSLL